MLFTDTITLYHLDDGTYTTTVVDGVQWSDKAEKEIDSGKVRIARYVEITLPQGKYEGLTISPQTDAIFQGEVTDQISDEKGKRLSDVLKAHPKSGMVQTINDNTNRTMLKNMKVILNG